MFPDWLTLDERPHLPRALGSAAFDGEGLATYAKPFVENGRLVSYVLGSYSARKLGMQSRPMPAACTTSMSATARRTRPN